MRAAVKAIARLEKRESSDAATRRAARAARKLLADWTEAKARRFLQSARARAALCELSASTRRRLGVAACPHASLASTDTRRKWMRLQHRGEYHAGMRALMRKRSGVYAVRSVRGKRVLYVGESHTRRAWKTMLRHFQDSSGFFASLSEWTHRDPSAVEVAFMPTASTHARIEEENWINELRPEANVRGFREYFEDEAAPF